MLTFDLHLCLHRHVHPYKQVHTTIHTHEGGGEKKENEVDEEEDKKKRRMRQRCQELGRIFLNQSGTVVTEDRPA